MKIVLPIIFVISLTISCTKKESDVSKFYSLTNSLKPTDSVEYRNENPFVYIKTGKIISAQNLNGLLVENVSDSLYRVELYTLTGKGWLKNDEVSFYEKDLLQFLTVFKDYDFDGQKDLYIQSTASNGYSLSYGNLILINKETKKLKLIKEAKRLTNMNPDSKLKLVLSESVDWCPDLKICKLSNQWKQGNLITIKKECPCE